ncbi:SWIM-type domain-containing protein [Trichonephila clavipes]|nr:SWIM-type domain-containing protein [Trichonephila clavipes]
MGKGQKLFNDGFVSSISFTEPDNASNENFIINCKVRAEMKKRVTYQPSVEIRTTCQIITAKCTCPAGSAPAYCKHVFALLHAIEDYVRNELFYASTERLQTWHHPKPSKTVPQETSKIFKGESSKRRLLNTNFDYDAINFCPFMEVMRNESEVIFEKSILLPAAVCSQKNMDEILALERRTMGQNCSEWHLERKLRLTASDTKLIISRVADFKTLASQILKKKDDSLDFIPAVKYGLEHEDYIRYIVQQRNPQNVVRQTGLVIHPLEQYIAASPDGLIRSEVDFVLYPKDTPL